MDYLDLYLLHWPVSLKSVGYDLPFSQKDLVAMDVKSVWEAMEECHSLGLSRNIGVSTLARSWNSYSLHRRSLRL